MKLRKDGATGGFADSHRAKILAQQFARVHGLYIVLSIVFLPAQNSTVILSESRLAGTSRRICGCFS